MLYFGLYKGNKCGGKFRYGDMMEFFNIIRKKLDNQNFFKSLIFLYAMSVVIIQLPKLICCDLFGYEVNYLILGFLSLIISFCIICSYMKIYPEYKLYFRKNLLVGIVYLFIVLVYFISAFLLEDFSNITSYSIGLALITGISEEIGNREIMISQLFKKYLKEKYIIKILLITSVFFSVYHIFNLFFGQSLYDTVNQCIFTLGFGFLVGAIFIRTGNAFPCILAHVINNILAFCSLGFKNHFLLIGLIEKSQIVYYIFSVIMILVAFYIVRKSKRDEIIYLWKQKWNNN